MARGEADPAGDADYRRIGDGYSNYRRPDPYIAQLIELHLAGAIRVLNVGAGAGSYEPRDREVTAVEPSATMRAMRPPDLPQAIDARAEDLPFPDGGFDASMATFTVHQWPDLASGLSEMRRVTCGPVIVLTCDPARVRDFWLNEYAPEVLDVEAGRYPALSTIAKALGGASRIVPVPIPLECADCFNEAYYGRPEGLLMPDARRACSAWSFVGEAAERRFTSTLSRDLADGTWDKRFGHLRRQPFFDGSLRLIVGMRVRQPGKP
jgi:SAM-dependent methyltransferase